MNAQEKYQEILDKYHIEDINLVIDQVAYQNQLCERYRVIVETKCIDERYFDLYGGELCLI